MMINYSIVLPASGTGQRFNNKVPKQFVLIKNRPLIYYTINSFLNCSQLNNYKLNEIVISCSKDYEDFIQENAIKPLIKKNNSLKITLIRGGEYRHQSIFNCLNYLSNLLKDQVISEHIVLIHDAVRPLIDADLIKKLIKNALNYGACGPICNLSSTILKVDKDGFLDYSLNRDEFKASEMPQSFRFDLILSAYKLATESDIKFGTECLHLIRKYTNSKVKLIQSDANKLFKVTYKKDYFSALGMLKEKINYQSLTFNLNNNKIDLIKFNSNLNLIKLNDLENIEFEYNEFENNECDVLFLFTIATTIVDYKKLKNFINSSIKFKNLILIFLILNEHDKYELMINFSQSFMLNNKITILFSLDTNLVNNLILYDKIKLICNNFNLMIAQYINI